MLAAFKNIVSELGLNNHKFLLAVSGGADSVCLFHLFRESNLRFEVAHINYKQRGIESDKDEELVREYCSEFNVVLHTKHWDRGSEVPNFQEEARNFRYAFFQEIISNNRLDILVTGHHKNDNQESFFLNLSRGAGLKGLKGMSVFTKSLFRPLLEFNRDEIRHFLESRNYAFREDASNENTKYKRNYVRHDLLPAFKKLHPKADSNLTQSIGYLQDSFKELNSFYTQLLKDLLVQEKNGELKVFQIHIPELLKQVKAPATFINFLFDYLSLDYHYSNCVDLERLIRDKQSESKMLQLGEWNIEVHQEFLYLYSGCFHLEDEIIEDTNKFIHRFSAETTDNTTDQKIVFKANKIFIDAKKLKFPLKLRAWQHGDKMKVFGMKGKSKKVSDLFAEFNYSAWQKQLCRLLVDSDENIILFDNKVIADSIKLENSTKKYYVLKKN